MAERPHVMLVEARFYPAITDELVRGAVLALEEAGAGYERFAVPGAFEIPAAIQMAVRARSFTTLPRRFDGFVALGCVIRGETSHYDLVCQESARALQELALRYTLAIGYGILTVDNEAQAWERARVERRNKGGDAARACLRMLELKRHFNLFPR
ncbi:MAG: 6,7-dimethyl-8-ribityllumazine synthase [Alphaproteobacteria bacterium]